MKDIYLAVIGLSSGLMVSGGVFTVLLSVGLVPRFAGKTHTGGKIFLYEEMIVFGTLFGNMMSAFEFPSTLGEWIVHSQFLGNETEAVWNAVSTAVLCIAGVFAGIFVGCLAAALAEVLQVWPILFRRTHLKYGLGLSMLCFSIGKAFGGLYYFFLLK